MHENRILLAHVSRRFFFLHSFRYSIDTHLGHTRIRFSHSLSTPTDKSCFDSFEQRTWREHRCSVSAGHLFSFGSAAINQFPLQMLHSSSSPRISPDHIGSVLLSFWFTHPVHPRIRLSNSTVKFMICSKYKTIARVDITIDFIDCLDYTLLCDVNDSMITWNRDVCGWRRAASNFRLLHRIDDSGPQMTHTEWDNANHAKAPVGHRMQPTKTGNKIYYYSSFRIRNSRRLVSVPILSISTQNINWRSMIFHFFFLFLWSSLGEFVDGQVAPYLRHWHADRIQSA